MQGYRVLAFSLAVLDFLCKLPLHAHHSSVVIAGKLLCRGFRPALDRSEHLRDVPRNDLALFIQEEQLLVAVSLTKDVRSLAERRSHSCPNAITHVGDPLVFLWPLLATLAQ
jgi:hypothetical protein